MWILRNRCVPPILRRGFNTKSISAWNNGHFNSRMFSCRLLYNLLNRVVSVPTYESCIVRLTHDKCGVSDKLHEATDCHTNPPLERIDCESRGGRYVQVRRPAQAGCPSPVSASCSSQVQSLSSAEHSLHSNAFPPDEDSRSRAGTNHSYEAAAVSNISRTTSNGGDHDAVVTPLMRQLSARIRATGAITVAQFMIEVLANPTAGYYTRHADISAAGDFITAPELTPIYGELIGVWLYHEWCRLGSPQPVQLVEMGPGRGSLIADILRVWDQVAGSCEQLRVCLVETSCAMLLQQASTLRATDFNVPLQQVRQLVHSPRASVSNAPRVGGSCDEHGQVLVDPCDQLTAVTGCGRRLSWHSRLENVPRGFSLLLANEFLDTMPTHQFRKTDRGWREVLVDTQPDKPLQFRFVLAPGPTPALALIDENVRGGQSEQCEVAPRADMWIDGLAARLHADGGVALLVDYGPDYSSDHSAICTDDVKNSIDGAVGAAIGDSLRAFRRHKSVDPLNALGTADVTCDVDLWRLQRRLTAATGQAAAVVTAGPVTQAQFLTGLGLQQRVQALCACHPDQSESLRAVQRILLDDMGSRFKVLAVYPASSSFLLQGTPCAPGF